MSVSGGPNLSEDGLVLYLDAANNKSYPRTGTSWIDLTGNNNAATLIDGPTFSGANNGSIVFDGPYFDATDPFVTGSLTGSVQLTVATWIKPASDHASPQTIASANGSDTTYWQFTFYENGNDVKFLTSKAFASSNGTEGARSGFNTVPLNKWVFVVGTASGSANQLFINGAITATGTGLSTASAVPQSLKIGELFSGSIANFQVYNRRLSPQEVLQNFNAQRSRFGI